MNQTNELKTGTTLEKNLRIPEYEAAMDRNIATFSQLVMIAHKMKGKDAKPYAYYYPIILKSFEEKYGSIVDIYTCSGISAGVALTEKEEVLKPGSPIVPDLFFEYCSVSDLELQELLSEIRQLRLESHRYLEGNDLRNCLGYLFSAARNLLCLIECPQQEPDKKKLLCLIRDQVRKAHEYHDHCAKLRSHHIYIKGVFRGALYALVALAIGCIPMIIFYKPGWHLIILCSIAGATGALVSVMSRVSRGEMRCRYQLESKLLTYQGIFRPILGAISGVVIYLLAVIDWIPIIEGPKDPVSNQSLYIVLGFLSGFSERWFQDMLLMKKGIGGQSKREKPEEIDAFDEQYMEKLKIHETNNNHVHSDGGSRS